LNPHERRGVGEGFFFVVGSAGAHHHPTTTHPTKYLNDVEREIKWGLVGIS